MSLRIFITGANRGLGLEFVRQYLAEGARVFAAARNPAASELAQLKIQHGQTLTLVPLDVTQETDLRAAVATVQQETPALDLLINNAAVNRRGFELGNYERGAMLEAMHVNAVAPVLIGQAFHDLLRKGMTPKIVNISTQIGSFASNQDGYTPLYAASKAALNMYTRSFAHEAQGIIAIAVHPGWVRTDMGGQEAPLSPEDSIRMLRKLIAHLTLADSGRFFNYDGQPHPY